MTSTVTLMDSVTQSNAAGAQQPSVTAEQLRAWASALEDAVTSLRVTRPGVAMSR